ncbi:MAG: hypothetical protein IJQ73_15345 [Kiritimatiellae bacterium]|nr:hypothetical protein [Kiritimatiellia bacterium]
MKTPHSRHHIPHFALALAVIAASAAPLAARTLYVTPAGAGLKDGSSWANALAGYGGLRAVVASGDAVRFAVGDYPVSNELNAANFASLELRGGYAGTDDIPAAKAASGETRLAVPSGIVSRHLRASKTTLVLEDLVFTGGSAAAKGYGCGLHLTTCTTAITNCVFGANGKSESAAQSRLHGGAIHASGGSLDIFGSCFTNNFFSATADNVWFDGAALYASAVALTIADTIFDGNTLSDTIKPCQGAALFLTGGNAFIDGCTFTTNTLYGNHNGNIHTGAAIHAAGVTGLIVRDSYFAGNVSKCRSQVSGGLICLSGATEATTMRLERCVFKANGPTADNQGMCASISLNQGELEMEHCLFAELSLPRSGSFKRAIDI